MEAEGALFVSDSTPLLSRVLWQQLTPPTPVPLLFWCHLQQRRLR